MLSVTSPLNKMVPFGGVSLLLTVLGSIYHAGYSMETTKDDMTSALVSLEPHGQGKPVQNMPMHVSSQGYVSYGNMVGTQGVMYATEGFESPLYMPEYGIFTIERDFTYGWDYFETYHITWSHYFAEVAQQPCTKSGRRRYGWSAFSRVLRDPRLENHCLFAAMAYFLGVPETLEGVRLMRTLAVKGWLQTTSSMGMTLAQISAATNRSPYAYIQGLLHQQWGGYREALVMGELLNISVRIWDARGRLLANSITWSPTTADLYYSGSHDMAVQISWSTWFRALPCLIPGYLNALLRVGKDKLCCSLTRLAATPEKKKIKQRRGRRARCQERRAGRENMSPFWWAETVWRFSMTGSTDHKKREKTQRRHQILDVRLKTQRGQKIKIRKPLPEKNISVDSPTLSHSRESCAELADSRPLAVCPTVAVQAHLQSCMGTGGGKGGEKGSGAAAVRSRITAKLAKGEIKEPSQLVNILWACDEQALQRIKGQPETVQKDVLSLAEKWHIRFETGRWHRDPQGDDPLFHSDPWSSWKDEAKPRGRIGQTVLRSSFIDAKGEQIPVKTLDDLLAAKQPLAGSSHYHE